MQGITKTLASLFFLILIAIINSAYAGRATLADRQNVQQFIREMVTQYHFSGPTLQKLFQQVQFRPDILVLMNQPREASSWYRYRTFFITPSRINAGVIFWNTHNADLQAAEKKYGVPPALIVSIIGVETQYGEYLGKYRVIDALSTLAFKPSPRQAFFRNELKEYLLLAREQQLNPLVITGSYAGAIGMPQFMPSSYRSYAVSSDGTGKINLLTNHADAISSVANYFKIHGWQPNQSVIIPAAVNGNQYQRVINRGFKPQLTLSQLASLGIRSTQNFPNTNKAILIQLQNPKTFEYWLGLNNFYVITTYNPSTNYAMAVYQLSQEIEKKRKMV